MIAAPRACSRTEDRALLRSDLDDPDHYFRNRRIMARWLMVLTRRASAPAARTLFHAKVIHLIKQRLESADRSMTAAGGCSSRPQLVLLALRSFSKMSRASLDTFVTEIASPALASTKLTVSIVASYQRIIRYLPYGTILSSCVNHRVNARGF